MAGVRKRARGKPAPLPSATSKWPNGSKVVDGKTGKHKGYICRIGGVQVAFTVAGKQIGAARTYSDALAKLG